MKAIKLIGFVLVMAAVSFACSGDKENKDTADNDEKTTVENAGEVNVYYFHTSRRCPTCKTVEAVAKESVQELYGDEVSFAAYNIDEPEGEKMAEKINVAGQALLIVGGDQKIDITNEGFMYAKSNLEKFKQIIKEKVDPLL